MEIKTFSSKEFAHILGISKNHLLKLEAEGKVDKAERVKRGKVEHRRYEVADIAKFRSRLNLPPLLDERRTQLFLNFKGGTGKSTLSANYAYAIAEMGVEVLAIDLDAQQHMTKCLGFEPQRDAMSMYEVLIDDVDINEVIQATPIPTLDIIPANIKLSVIENRLPMKEMKEFLLTSALHRIECKDYKVIVMDSLPNITMLNKNAILAAKDLLIPVLPDFLSYDGLKLLFEELVRLERACVLYTDFRRFRGGIMENIYVIVNQYRPAEVMSRQNRRALEQEYAEHLADTIIPYSTKLAQSTASGKPIFQYHRNSPAADQILALVHEILGIGGGTAKRRGRAKTKQEVTS